MMVFLMCCGMKLSKCHREPEFLASQLRKAITWAALGIHPSLPPSLTPARVCAVYAIHMKTLLSYLVSQSWYFSA
jgi:hypothetical protein